MHRFLSRFGLLAIDAAGLAAVPFIALFLRFDGAIESRYVDTVVFYLPVIVAVQLVIFQVFHLYSRMWKYAGVYDLLSIIAAGVTGVAFLFLLDQAGEVVMPRTIFALSCIMTILMVGGTRLLLRLYYNRCLNNCGEAANILIIGAGDVGSGIAKELRGHYGVKKKIVGFIDDDPSKAGKRLNGSKVLGGRADIGKIVNQYMVKEIIVAIPSARSLLVREIVNACRDTKCDIKIVPALHEVIDGRVTMRQLRDVNLEDLLMRQPVKLDSSAAQMLLRQKRVLITGAGGSIGSEICRQVAKLSPAKLFLLGKSENNIFEIERELLSLHPRLEIEAIIADVRDDKRIRSVFTDLRPQIIFHAAAHKHVPLMESQPVEAVQNNIFGTMTVAKAAMAVEAEAFVMISTDKAINPSSVMGVTKRVAEMIICCMNGKSATKFAAVRFGNVLGSRGSVVQLFRKQIARGEALTITHPDMCRYFMTIPEAAQLVLQAGAMARGGEVFVLDMGQPIKIIDLASNLIELSGLKPYKDIQIEFTGLRPGEKLYEELLSAEEGSTATRHEKIYVANLKKVDEEKLFEALNVLKPMEETDKILNILARMVPTYQCSRVRRLRVIEGKDNVFGIDGKRIIEETN